MMFVYQARVWRDDRPEAIELEVLSDDAHFGPHEGDEFLTVSFDVDPFDRPPAPGKDMR